MRRLCILFVLTLSFTLIAQAADPNAPVVCVSATSDTTGKTIGPLGNLNDDLAAYITEHRKPLRGLPIPADVTGRERPREECDYILNIKLHVGGSTEVRLNPPSANPLDPTNDSRGALAGFLVRASYQLTPATEAVKSVKLDDSITAKYEPNVGGYGTNLPSVAKRLAQDAAYAASGRLKKKLKL